MNRKIILLLATISSGIFSSCSKQNDEIRKYKAFIQDGAGGLNSPLDYKSFI